MPSLPPLRPTRGFPCSKRNICGYVDLSEPKEKSTFSYFFPLPSRLKDEPTMCFPGLYQALSSMKSTKTVTETLAAVLRLQMGMGQKPIAVTRNAFQKDCKREVYDHPPKKGTLGFAHRQKTLILCFSGQHRGGSCEGHAAHIRTRHQKKNELVATKVFLSVANKSLAQNFDHIQSDFLIRRFWPQE